MIVRRLAFASIAVVLGSPTIARAQTASDVNAADALFKDAKRLADAGRYKEACPRFAESQRLATGIGVTMHLADCYERTGQTTSAWAEFREAEKLAREHDDPRAEVAKERASALDEKMSLEQADVLFKQARQLSDAGHQTEACPKFAASAKLAPRVGVTLYLADCYERIGLTASAWTEFRAAESFARENHDARALTARVRARALEPKLRRLTIAVPKEDDPGAYEVRMDGAPLPRDQWNVALAVDPIDHEVTLRAAGRAERTLTAHVVVDSPPLTVQFDDAAAAEAAPAAPAPLTTVAAAAPVAAKPASPPTALAPTRSTAGDTRRWVEFGLLGRAAGGGGVGAAFLVTKNDSMTNGTPNGSPHEDAGFAAASAIGFGVGGAALVSAIVLYLVTPTAKEDAFVVAPVPLVGGAGLAMGARF